jgi:hypothetical protein
MVDAGVEMLSRLDLEWELPERIVRDVFEAMATAQRYGYRLDVSGLRLAGQFVRSTPEPIRG